MTQSSDDDTITISIGDYTFSDSNDLSTITTSDTTLGYDLSEYTVDTIDISSITTSTGDITFNGIDYNFNNNFIDPSDVENMCKEYPALSKVWQNFKSVYDMVLQDYKGKQKAGEVDDDEVPF